MQNWELRGTNSYQKNFISHKLVGRPSAFPVENYT